MRIVTAIVLFHSCVLIATAARQNDDEADTLPPIIRYIHFQQHDVFDSKHNDWFFGAGLLNAFHTVTRPYVIEDELLLVEDDELDTIRLLEIERNLRRTGLFSTVRVRTIPDLSKLVNKATGKVQWPDSIDIEVETQDRFSLRPAILFGTGGGITNIGAKLEESNLFGTATQVGVQGLYRTENSIGWEGYARIAQRRLFRTEIGAELILQANQFRTDQFAQLYKAYRTMHTPWAFSLGASNAFGRDFAYRGMQSPVLLPFHDRAIGGWISQAYGEEDSDRLFMSAAFKLSSVNRTIPESRQAFDNTGYVLVSFSSLNQQFGRTAYLDGYETEDIVEGGWGNATLGRVFSLGNGGQTMWYVGGEAERSWFVTNNLYLFGQVNGASGFGSYVIAQNGNRQVTGSRALYTSLGVTGLAHWRPTSALVVTARAQNQTVWNWSAFHQQILDLESGLRGYPANRLTGDNRFVSNAEVRWFPGWKWWIIGVSGVAFWDMGTVWNQGQPLSSTQFHHAIGFGVRIHNLKASGADAIFRFDFAYSLDERKFTGIIFTTNQLFSAFGRHQFKPPTLYGTSVDVR